ncbi:MAG: hypothetical protein Rhob2KO_53620 [Rhodopirellula baltica]
MGNRIPESVSALKLFVCGIGRSEKERHVVLLSVHDCEQHIAFGLDFGIGWQVLGGNDPTAIIAPSSSLQN